MKKIPKERTLDITDIGSIKFKSAAAEYNMMVKYGKRDYTLDIFKVTPIEDEEIKSAVLFVLAFAPAALAGAVKYLITSIIKATVTIKYPLLL